MILLNRCRHGPPGTNPVTTHHQRARLSISVQDRRIHRFRIFDSQFKDVTDLDPPPIFKFTTLTTWAGIAGYRLAKIGKLADLEITFLINPDQMEINGIATDDKIGQSLHLSISNNLDFQPDRPGKTGGSSSHLFNHAVFGQKHPVNIEKIGQLDHIQLTVTTQKNRKHLIIRGLNNQSFD